VACRGAAAVLEKDSTQVPALQLVSLPVAKSPAREMTCKLFPFPRQTKIIKHMREMFRVVLLKEKGKKHCGRLTDKSVVTAKI
jgi:hypothetical protein